jgi:hypothetical protein
MCTLRASGADFDVEAFLVDSSIEVSSIYRRGEVRLTTRPDGPRNDCSGFNAPVSEREWDDLEGQIQDAEAYLSQNEAEIRRLREFPGVDGIELDFPIDLRIGSNDIVVQSDRLPPGLLLAAGTLGMEICISIYPPCSDDEQEVGSHEA